VEQPPAREERSRGRAIIAMAIATGICIIALAWFSRRVFTEPISDLYLALPPFLMTFHEEVHRKARGAWYGGTVIWILAEFAATVAVILLSWN
jgi:hypothetical protein